MSPHKVLSRSSMSPSLANSIIEHGFLPAVPPLESLSNKYYEPWEAIISDLPSLLKTSSIRARIDDLPVLATSYLKSESEWQRAFLILAVMVQGYIWSGAQPSERLPPAMSIPFLKAASKLEMQPIAAYAALNLWNWRPLGEKFDLADPERSESRITFTGTDDESWFFTISNAMEARAAPLIQTMLEAIDAAKRDRVEIVVASLRFLQQSLLDIAKLLDRMDERCDPQVFYHQIRPWLAGSLNDKLPRGVFYDEGDGRGSWRQFRGGSNGQSSLVQFFDAVLSVNHEKTASFHKEMRTYMPGPHASFLEDIASTANIRRYVVANREIDDLVTAFDGAIASLCTFRDKHIQLVTRYIILPSRAAQQLQPKPQDCQSNVPGQVNKLLPKELIGTGGTTLVPFLRQSRNETKATALLDAVAA